MADTAPFQFDFPVPLPLNDADFIDITSSLSGHIGAGVDERMEVHGLRMKMYDAEEVEREMLSRSVSEEEAKTFLTPAYMVFSIACGKPVIYLLSSDGDCRAEVLLVMHETPHAEIWDYRCIGEEPKASISFLADPVR